MAKLLLAGKSPRRILDTIQVGAAQVILETQNDLNFSLPQHCYEYCNTMGWFFDNFAHKQRIKLLFTAASYLNRAAWHQKHTGDLAPVAIKAPAAAASLAADAILARVEAAITTLDGPGSVAWTQAYLDTGADAAPLAYRIALAATRLGNDPHNQEIAQCLLEDYPEETDRPGRDLPATGGGTAHRRASQIRRPAGSQPPLWRGHGHRRIELTPACRPSLLGRPARLLERGDTTHVNHQRRLSP